MAESDDDLFSDPTPNHTIKKENTNSNNNNNKDDSNNNKDDSDNNKTNSSNDNKVNDNKSVNVSSNQAIIQSATVKNNFVKDNVAYYDIHVHGSEGSWSVTKRYSQFEELHNFLAANNIKKLPILPAKHNKVFTDHLNPTFTEQRKALLDNYVKKLLKLKDILSQQVVVSFFNENKTPISNDNNDNKNDGAEKQEWEFPEDQEVTSISIPSTRKMTDHVLYQIEVTNDRNRKTFRTWTVLRRFGTFYDVDTKIRQELNSKSHLIDQLPPAPPRRSKLVYDHMDDSFIEERRVLLEHYLNKLIRIPEVAKNESFLEFLRC